MHRDARDPTRLDSQVLVQISWDHDQSPHWRAGKSIFYLYYTTYHFYRQHPVDCCALKYTDHKLYAIINKLGRELVQYCIEYVYEVRLCSSSSLNS